MTSIDERPMAGAQGDVEALDRILTDTGVVLVVGPGGVGKTTMAAALAVRAATRHDRRVLVVTVDPARRLADALGIDRLTGEAVLVPVGGPGRMWAQMVDMAQSWDRLVAATSPDPATADGLLANGLYRALTRRFIQSHDYIALDHLVDLGDDPRYDLVIVDSPPSRHAIDLIDAPGRMIDFFDSRLLRWLTFGAGPSLTSVAARPFLKLAERLLGRTFLTDIMEFFTLFARLRPNFVDRARLVEARLGAEETSWVVVSTAEETVVAGCQELTDELERRRRRPDIVIVNRLLPGLSVDRVGAGLRLVLDPEMADGSVSDPELAGAVERLLEQAGRSRLPTISSRVPTVAVPSTVADLTRVDELARLLDRTVEG